MGVKVYTASESSRLKVISLEAPTGLLLHAECEPIHSAPSEEHASQRMKCNIYKFHSSLPGGVADSPPSFLTSLFSLLSLLVFKTNQSQDQKSCSQNKANKNKINSNPSIYRAKTQECPALCFCVPYNRGRPGANRRWGVTA